MITTVPIVENGKPRALKQIRKDIVLATFELCNRNRTETAEALGVGRNTVYRWLASYGVPVKEMKR